MILWRVLNKFFHGKLLIKYVKLTVTEYSVIKHMDTVKLPRKRISLAEDRILVNFQPIIRSHPSIHS